MNRTHKNSIFATIAMCCLAVIMAFAGCSGGGDDTETEHSHSFSSSWSYDETGHWHDCTGEGCSETSEYAVHTFDDGGICTVCGYEEVVSSDVYSLTITNQGGTVVSGVDVELYNASRAYVTTGTTGTNGAVRFRDLAEGNYTAQIVESTLPKGYSLADDQVQISLTSSNKRVTVALETSLITGETMPSGTLYKTGSVAYDFTVTCVDDEGGTYDITLSDYLDDYGAVFINFFYTTCGPCASEVPVMQQAYTDSSLKGKVGLIAFDYTGNGDTTSDMISFKNYYGLTFDFTLDTSGYYGNYGVTGFPTTVIIDRYGCVAEINTGSNTAASSWISMFEYYISDSYTPAYSSTRDEDSSSSLIESTVTMPSSEEIEDTIVNTSDASRFTFSNYSEDGVEDVYNWPWVIGEDTKANVSDYIVTSNAGIVGGYSIIVIDVSLTAGEAVLFDMYVSTEESYDLFYVQVDTVLQGTYSGDSGEWETCLAYVAQYSGDYQITLYYQKDSSRNRNDDAVYVSNLRTYDASELATLGVSGDILYNAANNYTTAETVNGVDVSTYGEGYGYINYASVYLASDGWYRVDINNTGKQDGDVANADDPYLLADLYYGTPWYSAMSIWDIAYYGTSGSIFDSESENYIEGAYDDIEEYAWVQNNCPWGYVPVNAELHDYLVKIVSETGRETYTEYEWLEVCRYYVHYGADHASGDSCYSLDNLALTYGYKMAVDLGEISATDNTSNDTAYTFTAEVPTLITPRGNYYSFTVDTSGVYRIYSYDLVTDSDAAPLAYIMDSENNQLEESELDDLAYMDGFYRTGVGGSLTPASDGTITFTPVYSATYSFTLSGSDLTSAVLTDGNETYYIKAGADSYTFSLTLTAGTEYTFKLSGAGDDTTLDYEITDDAYSFAFYIYLEAGETYYIAATFGSTEQTGSYDIGIYYIGEELTYFTTLATGYVFTYYEYEMSGETYYEYYLPTRVGYKMYGINEYGITNDDGEYCWYTVGADGGYDQLIYIDLLGTTWYTYYSNVSIEYAIENNTEGWNDFNLATLNKYLEEAKANTGTITGSNGMTWSLYGCVPAYADLVELLNELANGNDEVGDSTYADNAWMLAAYYVREVKAS